MIFKFNGTDKMVLSASVEFSLFHIRPDQSTEQLLADYTLSSRQEFPVLKQTWRIRHKSVQSVDGVGNFPRWLPCHYQPLPLILNELFLFDINHRVKCSDGTHCETLWDTVTLHVQHSTVATCRIYVDKLQSSPVILYSTEGPSSETILVK